MRHQTHKSITFKSITFVLALLLALSSWAPMPGRAEVQMRCAGASPYSAPCARAVLPAAGLTEAQAYANLLPCCRFMQVSAMQSCFMQHSSAYPSNQGNKAYHFSLSARHCFVTIHIAAAGATAPALSPTRCLTALAPPVPVQFAFAPALFTRPAFRTFVPILSPHILPHLHGLRAPPVA